MKLSNESVRIKNHTFLIICTLAIPPPPKNVNVAEILGTTDTESSVNLAWSLDNQLCVVVYHVEVTSNNTSNITNMNTTSQYIVLTLQTGVVYSVRVRGVDSAGRGEWSELLMYTGESRFQVIMCLVLPQSLISYSTTAILSTASIHTITSSATAMPTSTVSPTNNGKLTLHVHTCVHSWWPNHSILTIFV